MSDSEDESAFASADEGGEEDKPKSTGKVPVKKDKASAKGTTWSPKKDVSAKASSQDSTASATGDQVKKSKNQQQKGKKKGKPSTQSSPKTDSAASEEVDSSQTSLNHEEAKTPKSKGPASVDKTEQKNEDKSEQRMSKSASPKVSSGGLKEDSKSETLKTAKSDGITGGSNLTPNKDLSANKNSMQSDATFQAGDVRRGTNPDMASPEGQDISRDQRNHHTDKEENVLKGLDESAQKGSGWGWGSWGSSLISAATSSIETFSHQVGDGLTTIMDTVESSLGVPDPNELAQAEAAKEPQECIKEEPKKSQRQSESEGSTSDKDHEDTSEVKDEADVTSSGSWFSSWGDMAKKVQEKSKTLATKGQTLMAGGFDAVENLAAGGIDVLETIGKKTYNTLSEHDPAFKKTRDYLNPKANKPNLSSVLKEAKERAEEEAEEEKQNEEARKAHFGTLFDDYQGIAHLEALEILSNRSEKKVHSLLNSLSSDDLTVIKPLLIAIKEAFELPEDDDETDMTSSDQDFANLVSQCLSELELGTAPDKLNKVHEMVKQWMVDFDANESHGDENLKSIHQRSIQSLAELTSKGVEQFHKAGELVLMDKDTDKDCTERAHSLARLTSVLCHEVGNLATKFAGCLNKIPEQDENGDEITALVTNIYLEASNSSTYLQDAFQLLLPVLQHAALEHSINSRHHT